MKRAACMAALLACVSPLAIGTAHAFELSAPDDAQVADVFWAVVVVVVAYGVFQGLRRCFRGAGSAFWTSTLGRWLIGRIAGTLVFGTLLGIGFFLSTLAAVLLVMTLLRLGIQLPNQLSGCIVLSMWAGAIRAAWRLRTAAKVCIGKGSRPLRRWVRSLGMGGGGSSAFAGICEEWANRWKPGMILLGASMFDRKWLVGIRDDRMMMTVAGTGSGKNRSSIIPCLLTYPGSVYCQDFKGQNAAVTAQRRRDMGQTVHILDPMAALMENGARLNPVAPLDPKARDYVEQIDVIVDALVIGGDDKNRFFDAAARTLIAGLIDYVVRCDSDGEFEPPADDAAMEGSNVEQ
jgi:type IV secretory pathway TraG/TraD family ATPase VirD4